MITSWMLYPNGLNPVNAGLVVGGTANRLIRKYLPYSGTVRGRRINIWGNEAREREREKMFQERGRQLVQREEKSFGKKAEVTYKPMTRMLVEADSI